MHFQKSHWWFCQQTWVNQVADKLLRFYPGVSRFVNVGIDGHYSFFLLGETILPRQQICYLDGKYSMYSIYIYINVVS